MADSFPSRIGRYQVVRPLGRGGMGVVYLARDPFIERDVAVKLLRSIDDDDAHGRFQREIRIAGALSHPNIVRIYDAGTHEGQPFVAMEYVAGETVAEIIKRAAPIDLDRKLELLIDLSEGLGYAHKRGVIHRDIKPSNLIIDEHGRLKILDFGIARLADAGRTSTSLAGTPNYMAPEQMMGELVDARGDLFSCGVVVYEVVAYTLPFSAPSFYALYNTILHTDPAPLTSVAPGTPAALDTFIDKALAKAPDRRFQTAQAFGDALRAMRASLSAEETIIVAPPRTWGPPPLPVPDSGSGSGRAAGSARSAASKRLAEMRERERTAAREEARRALSEGRPADALEAAERALLLDEADAGAQELADLARESMDRAEAGRLLDEAQKHLDTRQFDQAQQAIQRLTTVPRTPGFAAIESQLGRLQRDLQRSRRREEVLSDVRRLVGVRDFESARGALAEAVQLGATDDDTLSLQSTIDAALRERQAEQEWHARAREVTARAQALFERDRFDEAIGLLEAFTPPHPEPTALLGNVRTRQAQVADEQRRRDREQQRQETRNQGLAEAESLLAAGDADAAMARLGGLRSQGFVDDAIETLEHRAADLRRVQANERRRAATLARGLDAARAAMARRNPDAALLVLEQLNSYGFVSADIDALTAEAEALQGQVARERQDQLEQERRLARLDAGLLQVRDALQRQDAERALAAIRILRQEGLQSSDIEGLERQADAMLEEHLRRRQSDLERDRRSARFRDGVGSVRAALDAEDHAAAAAALALLRAEGFDQPELADLESEAAGLQQRAARARVAQLEREQREQREMRLAQGAQRVRAAMEARDFDAVFAAIGVLRRDGLDSPEIAALESEAQTLQQRIAHEQFERLEHERRDARLGDGLDGARRALAARDPNAASAALGLLRRDGFDVPAIATLESEARDLQQQIDRERFEQIERERRRVRLAEALADVRAAIEKRDADAAAAALGLLRHGGFDAEADAVQDEVRALDEDAARQRREHIEREGRGSRLTRDAARIRESLERRDPDAALAILEALTHDGLSLPDQRKLAKEARKLRDHLLHEQAAAAAASVQQATATQTRTTPGGATTLPRWMLPVAAVAVLIVGGVVGTWLISRHAPVPAAKGPAVTVPATPSPATPASERRESAAPTDAATTAAPGTTAEPVPAVAEARAFEQATRLERRGDLRGAARALSNLAGRTPQSPEAAAANGRLKALAVESRRRAEQARQRAVTAGASGTPEFSAGSRRFEQAARAEVRGPILEGITGFLDAEASFDRAAATTRAATAAPTAPAGDPATPSAPPPSTAAPPVSTGSAVVPLPTAPPRGLDTPAAPVVAPSTDAPKATAPAAGASVDQEAIEAVVRRYFAARSRLDFAGVQEVYPGATGRERAQLKSSESACASFSEEVLGVDILQHAGATAKVEAHVRSSCRPRAGRAGPPNVVDIGLTLEKAGTTYKITQVNRPDRAR